MNADAVTGKTRENEGAERRPIALVTGGRRGIGRAIACKLASCGYDVAITDLEDDEDVCVTTRSIEAQGGRVALVRAPPARPKERAASRSSSSPNTASTRTAIPPSRMVSIAPRSSTSWASTGHPPR